MFNPRVGLSTSAGNSPANASVLADPTFGWNVFDDFTTGICLLSVTGTGANGITNGSSINPGVNQQSVAAVGDGARAQIGGGTGAFAVVAGAGAGPITWLGAMSMNQLSDGVNNGIVRNGMHDAAAVADAVNGMYFEYDFATNGDHRWRLCCANNSVRTKTDTGIIAVAGVLFIKFVITVNAAGTSVSGSIGGVAVAAPVTTNIPTGPNRSWRPSSLHLSKQLGAGAFIVIHDYHGASQAFTTVRS